MVVTRTMLRRSGHSPECLENFLTERHYADLATGVGLRNNQDGPNLGEGGRPCLASRISLMITTITTEGNIVLLTRRCIGLMVLVAAKAPVDLPGYREVKWMVTDDGSPPVICTPRWGAIERGPSHAGGGEGTMDSLCEGSFGLF